MRKVVGNKLKVSLITLIFAVVFALSLPMNTYFAKADNDYLPETVNVGVSVGEAIFPIPNIPNDWAYKVSLKKGDVVVAENVAKYSFDAVESYSLVYTIYEDAKLNDFFIVYVDLNIVDDVKPNIVVDNYEPVYYVGDILEIKSSTVIDNIDNNLIAQAELYLGATKKEIVNNKFKFDEEGDYKLVYKSTDSSGNEGILTYEFTVLYGNTAGNSLLYIIIGASAGLLLITGVGILIFVGKNKQNKKNKEEEK